MPKAPPTFDACTIAGLQFTPVSPTLTRARLTIGAACLTPLLIASVLLALWQHRAFWLLTAALVAMVVWLGWLIPRQVKALGYAETAEELAISRGIMWRSLTVVPYGRMQYVDVAQGPIARWCNIATVQLHTASAETDAELPGLPPKEAARLRDRLTARGEARRAGL